MNPMSTQTCQIEPVPGMHYIAAMRFLAGGGRKDLASARMAESIIALAHSRTPDQINFWWARRGRDIAAAAMVVANPGKTGMLIHCPPGHGVQSDILAKVVRNASIQAIQSGLSFVQCLVEPSAATSHEVLNIAGFSLLAELIYMSKALHGDTTPDIAEQSYTWRHYGQFDDAELAEVISLTYQQSLDCPGLAGLRKMQDVIASHKSSGLFQPGTWWVVSMQGRPAGCILVNDYLPANAADVVYLGVAPAFRGRGLSRLMLRRAGREAGARHMDQLTLAVDAANFYAYRVYQSEGFHETARRLAYALTKPRP